MRPDHIIIGSGINGLVAAAMLSLKGDRVLVLERETSAGGCLRSEEITLPGFQHDVMAATFVLFLTSPAGAALGPHLARHGFDYCHTPHPTAVLRPDGSSLVLTTDRAANIAAFNAAAPGDGDRHAADVGQVEADAPFLFALLGAALWSWPTLKLLFGQVRRRGLRGLAAWFGTALAPARGWLEAGYQSPLVQALHAPWVLHCGLTPESTYSGQMGKVIAFALEAAGAPIARGGAGQAVAAFRALIEENGGTIRTGADVARITARDGRVTGVQLADGEQIACASVLASVAPGLEDVALIHLADGIDSVSRSANEAERGLLPAIPTICVGQPHRLDPSRAPAGKAILWLQIPDAPRVIKGDAAGGIATDGTWSEATREAFADRIEAILAQHIKDFDQIRLARTALSPADLARMNVNLVGGDPYGGACTLDQFFLFRPFAHSTNGSGALRGLIHIGASTHPGPGLGGGSGFLAAKRLGA